MHLRSITLKGFKSFPDRTKLEFTPGVSVIVGPNGSGKSNVTDAVLWAMGEQSPLAVRGHSMQDVIFGGGRGIQARTSAEVELVLDNADGVIALPLSEISIVRRLDRSGDGEYRLNGARCRMADVLEVLSDTGLGKEMHSVVSQGRVEAIVTSKPRDRRLLIEEAAGLGKHRKRRRRAQLKLERTQQNLDRALDVEREARSRLRPLKRQAEAAELHERLARQSDEARWELARDAVRSGIAELEGSREAASAARGARDAAQAELEVIAVRRKAAEEALSQRSEQREALVRQASLARQAQDKIELRQERAAQTAEQTAQRIEQRRTQLDSLHAELELDAPDESGHERIAALEAELQRMAAEAAQEQEREVAALEQGHQRALAQLSELDEELGGLRSRLAEAAKAAEIARQEMRAAEAGAEAARRETARIGAELAAANQFLRTATAGDGAARALASELEVRPGYELAVAAALGDRLSAVLVDDLAAGGKLLDRAGDDGGTALVSVGAEGGGGAIVAQAPTADALRLAELIAGTGDGAALARALLSAAWVVDDLAVVPEDWNGIAVTRGGRCWRPTTGELHQAPAGGSERILEKRNQRDALIAASEEAVRSEQKRLDAVREAQQLTAGAEHAREEAELAVRESERARTVAAEAARNAAWLVEQRRKAPQEGAGAVRRAQLEGELQAERRGAERAARIREERAGRMLRIEAALAADGALLPRAERLAEVLSQLVSGVRLHVAAVEQMVQADRQAGEGVAAELRECASAEADVQSRLRERGEAVTQAEVRLARAREHDLEARRELEALAARLGLPAQGSDEPLAEEQAAQLRQRIERLARRREQLGPVNPLAKAEYEEAIAHVQELEERRGDLETALRELKVFISDTDKQIHETFEQTFAAAAANFEELAAQLFPGGRGRLRLVQEESGPKSVFAGRKSAEDQGEDASEAAAEAEAQQLEDSLTPDEELGVEIEITPAGKSMKRLTLLSGGEKSMTALAFLFAVFLAKPCPFYILDEVEAALDDINITRFLGLLQKYRDRAQFIVVTHQKRTMEAADTLYGVSMGDDGVSKIISRKLPRDAPARAVAATP
jgi:chromosome segregation protein